MKRLVLFALWLSSSCSLVVDGELARLLREVDAGPADGGLQDGGQLDAGLPPGDYDGGPRCPGSSVPRLRCDVTVLSDGGVGDVGLAALQDGLLVAFSDFQGVNVARVSPNGTRTAIGSAPLGNVELLRVSGAGSEWAVLARLGSSLTCFSGRSTTGVSYGVPAGASFDVAVAPTGATAIVRATPDAGSLVYGVSDGGCPPSLGALVAEGLHTQTAAVHLPSEGSDGFRFVTASNTCQGPLRLVTLDGGSRVVGTTSAAVSRLLAARSHDERTVYALSQEQACGGNSDTGALRAVPAGAQSSNGVLTAGFPALEWSALAGCGADCVASTVVLRGAANPPLVVALSGPSFEPYSRLAPNGLDALCSVEPRSSVASTFENGQLVLLVGESTGLRLLRCELPPR